MREKCKHREDIRRSLGYKCLLFSIDMPTYKDMSKRCSKCLYKI